MDAVKGLMDFIPASPTAFHAVQNIGSALEKAGYAKLDERERWQVRPGGRYYTTRNLSSVIAFRVPDSGLAPFQVVASHSDSPCFKLKPSARRESQGYAVMNVEKYGGMIMSSWFDRPLSVAGRVIIREGDGLRAKLVNIERPLALIPNLPIHFNRSVNDGVALNPQVDMLPVYGAAGADCMALAAGAAGVDSAAVVSADLFLVNLDAPRLWGANQEFIAAPRLDDLECAYTSLQALLAAKPSEHMDMLCVFDNEEVGSGSKQGANSTFLTDVMERIAFSLGGDLQALRAALAGSFMLSADNAHAVNPNHPEKYDEQNRVYMNDGVVVKSNASQKYTSDGVSQAVFERICEKAGVRVQRFANRSDIAGGSTLGRFAVAHASMNAVDIGLAQLAMHSANESAGARDVQSMIDAMRTFYETEIGIVGDGVIQIH